MLQLGLNFAAVPTQIPTHRILAVVEKILTKFTFGEANHVWSKVIGVIKNHRPPKPTLNSEESKVLKEICNDQNWVISKADKGNTTVVMDKIDYDKRLLTMLEDNITYQQLQKDPIPNTEKTDNEFVSQLVADNKITKIQSYRLKNSNGRAPVFYGLPQLHKENTPLRPIVSFIGSRLTIYQKTWHEFLVSWQEKATTMSEIRKTSQNLSHLLQLTMMSKWCLLMLSPFSQKYPQDWPSRSQKKTVRSFGQFGKNHFLVCGGYLQRPLNLLKCYQLNLSRETLQTNF